jgi:ubiquinone/menaquinone biosynthesis C-methylase UbiE
VSTSDPESQRVESLAFWERNATGWGRRADRIRDWGMPVSAALIDGLALQPGDRVLELAAGPGDTGFLAAGLIRQPHDSRAGGSGQAGSRGGAIREGTLLSSDGAEAMVSLARTRAQAAGIGNVEFRRLELEWIDLPAASVDAIICRWGIMLITDREAAAREIRRVVRPGGRVALAVWDVPDRNPWAAIPARAMIELGHAERPDPDAPGMFRLAPAERFRELLESAGFVEVDVEPVRLERAYDTVEEYIEETLDLSGTMRDAVQGLTDAQREAAIAKIRSLAEPFTAADGSLRLPGSSLVASAEG